MGRYKKIILFIAAVFVLAGLFSVLKRDKNNVSITVKKNEIVIDNFEMAKVVDDQNNFYRINASRAVMDRSAKIADLYDFTLVYKKGDTDFTASAGRGIMEDEVRVDVSGKIVGNINGMDFETGPEGGFHYDFNTDTGELSGNVVVKDAEGTIFADKAIIYHKENRLEFDGNVKVIYTE